MGALRDYRLEAFAERTGIQPATSELASALTDLQKVLHAATDIIPLEKSGIRDGDGGWTGCDAFGEALDDVLRQIKRVVFERESGQTTGRMCACDTCMVWVQPPHENCPAHRNDRAPTRPFPW